MCPRQRCIPADDRCAHSSHAWRASSASQSPHEAATNCPAGISTVSRQEWVWDTSSAHSCSILTYNLCKGLSLVMRAVFKSIIIQPVWYKSIQDTWQIVTWKVFLDVQPFINIWSICMSKVLKMQILYQ